MTLKEFKEFINSIPEENDSFAVVFLDTDEGRILVNDYFIGTYYGSGLVNKYINLIGFQTLD